MKKIFLLSSFIIALCFMLFAETKITVIHSVEDFNTLYQQKVFPFNKLSDTTFQRLKTTMVFDEEKNFRGFNYVSGLWKELTYEEYLEFDKWFGITEEPNENAKADYEKRKNRH